MITNPTAGLSVRFTAPSVFAPRVGTIVIATEGDGRPAPDTNHSIVKVVVEGGEVEVVEYNGHLEPVSAPPAP